MFDGPIRDHARWTPRAAAVITRARTVSYAEFNADIDRLGAALADGGVARGGGPVSLAVDSAYLQLVALAALSRLDVASSVAADERAPLRLSDQPGPAAPGLLRIDGDWVAAALAREPHPLPALEPAPDAAFRILLSSGTTGAPRRVAFSGHRIAADSVANLGVYGAGRLGVWMPLTGIDSLLGFSMTVLAWAQGATLANGMPLATLPDVIETADQGVIGLTPVKLRALLDALPADFRPRGGWRLTVAGSTLPARLAREAALRLTPDVRQQYGATESSQIAAGPAAPAADVHGLVGVTPAGAIVQVVDASGRPLADGQSGEIRVRGLRTASGYLDDPAATAERFRDGWFQTRDLGRRLADGRIVVEGRIDERMNLGGRKVLPGPLEAAALALPGVLDAAAFAAPDAQGFDQGWLAIVAAPGFDRDSLAAHLARQGDLPPCGFAWIDEIPRNAMGKIERGKLRDALLAATKARGA